MKATNILKQKVYIIEYNILGLLIKHSGVQARLKLHAPW